MTSFDLKLGFSCNNDCIHCVITDKKRFGDLTTKEIKKIIKEQEAEQFVFTGGEPTIRKDFIELLHYANKNKKIITLQTNGKMFKDKLLAEQASKYVDFFLVAIHSYDPFIHNSITTRKNSWEETVEGIKNLKKFNVNIISQTVISKLNCKDLIKTYHFIYKTLEIRNMNLTFPHPNGAALKNFNIVVPKYSEIHESITDVLRHYKWNISVESIPLCYLHPNIDVRTSENDSERNIKKGYDASLTSMGGFAEDYKSLKLSDKRKPDTCKECIYNNKCDGVWKEYYEIYKNELDLFPIKTVGRKNK